MNPEKPCPCDNTKVYQNCCKQLHDHPDGMFDLQRVMQARYSAYVFGIPSYIIETTHPANPDYITDRQKWTNEILEFSKRWQFHGLEVFQVQEDGITGQVVFTVRLSKHNKDGTFTEKSYFEKKKNRWLYRTGHILQGREPHLLTIHQGKILPLSYYGDEVLKKNGDLIPEINADVQALIQQLVDTMDACNGLGLAAPQVHHSLRLFVIRTPIEENLELKGVGHVEVFINPVISEYSQDTWEANEGCLSIPGILAPVSRPMSVTVEWTGLDNQKKKERVSGWKARVILHEYDHIQGVLFIDRLDQEKRSVLEPSLRALYDRVHLL